MNYIIGPLPPTIHRGLEWPQFLNSLLVCLFACLFSANFLIFYSTVQYSIVQYSWVPGLWWPALPHDPQGIRVASGFEFSDCLFACLFSANFLICYSTVQYSIVQYSTVQYSTVQVNLLGRFVDAFKNTKG